jgi:hypothetical protein
MLWIRLLFFYLREIFSLRWYKKVLLEHIFESRSHTGTAEAHSYEIRFQSKTQKTNQLYHSLVLKLILYEPTFSKWTFF